MSASATLLYDIHPCMDPSRLKTTLAVDSDSYMNMHTYMGADQASQAFSWNWPLL